MRTAIVTGAAKGIGKAIAGRLAHDGFTVVVADVDEPAAITEAAVLSGMGIGLDVSDSAAAKRMAATGLHRYGSIDVLVNNAGITGKAAPVHEYPDDEWRRVMAIDLDGVFYCTKAVLPSMLAKGSGRIINIASISGKEGNPNMPAYSTAKAGVIGFTKARFATKVLVTGLKGSSHRNREQRAAIRTVGRQGDLPSSLGGLASSTRKLPRRLVAPQWS